MPVMVSVSIVITDYSAMLIRKNCVIDISQVIAHYLPILPPGSPRLLRRDMKEPLIMLYLVNCHRNSSRCCHRN